MNRGLTVGCREDRRVVRPFAQGFLLAAGAVAVALLPVALYILAATAMGRRA